MQFSNQHIEAISKTVKVRDEVSAGIFSDKVKDMGRVTVSNGSIRIDLDFLPSMITLDAQRDFVVDAISLALRACFDARPSAFDRNS